MILGVDIGNYSTKVSNNTIFESKVSKYSLMNKNGFTYDGQLYYIGEGSFDTEYRKLKKQNLEVFFAYAVSKFFEPVRVVVGLPISQYPQDHEEFRSRLLNMRLKNIIDIAVYPEGIGAADEGIVIDIGGRTTDCCLLRNVNGQKKIENPISIPSGTLNLYSDFIKVLNTRYCLDLKLNDAQDIINNGLTLDGIKTDIRFATETFKCFVEQLVNTLNVEYSLRSKKVTLTGGGSQLLSESLLRRIPGATLTDNCIFANAYAFKKVGEQLWQR